MTVVTVLFVLLGAVSVGSALAVATSDSLVHCALWLVVALGALAGCYLLLAAEFVAWVQVLVYLGAVVVLLLFALMLTRAPTGAAAELAGAPRWTALVVAALTAGVLVVTCVVGFRDARIELRGDDIGTARALGGSLFGAWVLPFEIVSVILLAALVGAIVVSRRRRDQ